MQRLQEGLSDDFEGKLHDVEVFQLVLFHIIPDQIRVFKAFFFVFHRKGCLAAKVGGLKALFRVLGFYCLKDFESFLAHFKGLFERIDLKAKPGDLKDASGSLDRSFACFYLQHLQCFFIIIDDFFKSIHLFINPGQVLEDISSMEVVLP